MPGKIMYCAFPTRLRHLRDKVKTFAKSHGYAPVIPFDIGDYDDFEGNPAIGRERTLKFMIGVMKSCDVIGVFGISEGVMGELKNALDLGMEIHVFHGLDPEWEKYYEVLKDKYGDLLRRLRGSNHLFALIGARAVGKTFWSNILMAHFGGKLRRVKNTTTRKPRDASDHESYNFVSEEEFKRGIGEYRFLEWDYYLGNYYGSSLDDIRSVLRDSSGIFAITPTGAKALYVHRFEINLTNLLLAPASANVLLANFLRRGINDPKEQMELLLDAEQFSLPPEIGHRIVTVTGNTGEDKATLLSIVEPLIK